MGFFSNRSNKMRKGILNRISKHPNKIGFSIIFRSQESPAYIYRFIGSTYVVAKLQYLNWSLVKKVDELSWEELNKIKDSLVFVPTSEAERWIKRKEKSLLISVKQNFRKIFKKETLETKEYWH
jgi:protein tyrosine phosphatase